MDNSKCLMIGERAPSFKADTTYGPVSFPEDYKGSWVVFFSHPGAFTPVCTTEILTFASMENQFASHGCKLLGLSVDSNSANIQWCREMSRFQWNNIRNQPINFPIVSDGMGQVATLYGMIMPAVSMSKTVRDVFVIDPNGIIRAMLAYPLTTGRNIAEILRLVMALQSFDATGDPTPANWMPGGSSIYPPPQTLPQSMTRVESAESEGGHCLDWYICFTGPDRSGVASANMANTSAGAVSAGGMDNGANPMISPAQMAARPNMNEPVQVSPFQMAAKPNMTGPTQVSPFQMTAKPKMTESAQAAKPNMNEPAQVSPFQMAAKPNMNDPTQVSPAQMAAKPNMTGPTQVSPAQMAAKPNMTGPTQVSPAQMAAKPNMTGPTQVSPAQMAAKPKMAEPAQVSPAQTAEKPNMSQSTASGEPNIPIFEANRSMISGIGKQNGTGLTGGFPVLGNMSNMPAQNAKNIKKADKNDDSAAQGPSSDDLLDGRADYFITRDFPYLQ